MQTFLQTGSIVSLQLPAEMIPVLLKGLSKLTIEEGGAIYALVTKQVALVEARQNAPKSEPPKP